MYKFSDKSLEKLKGVHPLLVDCVHLAMNLQILDFSVQEGIRSIDRQKELVATGRSKTMLSKHIIQADGYGHAVDLYPSPIDMAAINAPQKNVSKYGKEIFRFGLLSGAMLSSAKKMGIIVVNGADWDGDGQTLDHTFFDAPHFQLVLR